MLNLRRAIKNNKLYAWMIVIILLIQAYAAVTHPLAKREKVSAKSSYSFAQEIETNKRLLQKALLENPQVAVNFAYISFFMLIAFLLGVIFLVNFLFRKARGEEPIPKTTECHTVLWNWKDAVRIVIIFLFFTYVFFVFENLLKVFSATSGTDKRMSMVLDTMFMDIFVLLVVIRFVTVKYKQKIAVLGISLKNIVNNINIALFSYLAFLPILTAIFLFVIFIARLLNYTPPEEPIYELIFKEKRSFVLTIISAMAIFIGPIIEEIFFRGFLYSALRKTLNITMAIIISACIFSLLHTNMIGFLPIVALGMFLAYLREKTGSLIPSICVHIVHNTALISLMFLAKYAISLGAGR